MLKSLKSIFKDARHFQLFYLGSFLCFTFLELQRTDGMRCLAIILTALLVQFVGQTLTAKQWNSWKSALITALGLCLLCKTNQFSTAILASVIAIGSKFLIRHNGKHLFNPVNIGLILTILMTDDAWISPGQWGSHIILLFVLGALGFLVLKKVNRLDVALTFLIVFGGLLFARNILYLGWPIDFFFHQITNGTLMLFTFFMITDPKTTPNHRTARIIWGILLAITSFILSSYVYFYTAPVWVLFFLTPMTPIFDKIWKAKAFEWLPTKKFKLIKIK